MRLRLAAKVLLVGLALAGSGCLQRLAVGQTAAIFVDATPAFDEQWDLDLAEPAAAAGIVQLEGIRRQAPDDDPLALETTKAYCGYAFAFVEDRMEAAEESGDTVEQDHQRHRAALLYQRAAMIGMGILRRHDGDFDTMMRTPEFGRWLVEEFDDADDAPALFWTGYAIASRVNVLRDAAEAVNLPFARLLIERSMQLDETYYNASGHVFLGALFGEMGQAIGGDPQLARRHFERALELTHRRALLVQLTYARTYAASQGDRALYERLLHEVLDFRDDVPGLRIQNAVARRRAQRYLREIDDRVLD